MSWLNLSKRNKERLGNVVRAVEAEGPGTQPQKRILTAEGGGQLFGKIVSANIGFVNNRRWTYGVWIVKWNQTTQAWDFVDSVFGVLNLNEMNNGVAACPQGSGLSNGNGTCTVDVGGFGGISKWAYGTTSSDNSAFRLMPASIGTPIVPLFKSGSQYFFELENGLAKLQLSCQ